MRIGIDCRIFDEYSGIGQYLRNVLLEFGTIAAGHEIILLGTHKDLKDFGYACASVVGHPYTLKGQIHFLRASGKLNLEIIYFPHFAVPIGLKIPFVATIHDLTMTHFSSRETSNLGSLKFFVKRFFYSATIKYALKNSQKIITISDFVREDIKKTYGISEDKIEVIYPGIPKFESASELKSLLRDKKYILYVGSFFPHKNIGLILDAIKLLPDFYLVLIGREDDFLQKLKSRFTGKVIFLGNVGRNELASCYKNAFAFVQPSLMEGFGFGALEALSQGTLVMVSDIPVHREILGRAAVYLNPKDVNSLARLLTEPNLERPQISDLPREYDFKNTALGIWKVLRYGVK